MEVRLIRDFRTGYHARNGGGDSISTDGDLPVVDLTRLRPQPGTVVPVATDRRHRRPAPTLFGVVLVVLGLAALALAAGLIAGSPAVVAEIDADALLPPVAVVLAAFGITEILLAWFILRGGNRSRLAAMSLSSAAIVTQWVAVLNGGPGVTFATNLVGLSLDILLIIALSSQRSRDFARQSSPAPRHAGEGPPRRRPGPTHLTGQCRRSRAG